MPYPTPGRYPAANSRAMDTSETTEYRSMPILGGMRMPMDAEYDVTTTEKSFANPRFSISGIRIEPTEAASATAEPETFANSIDVTIFACARPPDSHPTMALAKSISRPATALDARISPVKMKSGMARMTKETSPSVI